MTKLYPVALLVALAAAAPARAGEIFGGIYAHAVDTPLSLDSGNEGGVDVQLGYRWGALGRTPLQPYVMAQANLGGDTSFAAAGLSARFGDQLYVRPGLGLAIHTGSAGNRTHLTHDHIDFGSRILFAPELAVGVQLSERASVEASWVHLSHARLFGRQNPGIDTLGARVNLRF